MSEAAQASDGRPARPGRAAGGRPSPQNTGTSQENDLARQLSRLARQMQDQEDPQEVMARVVQAAVALVPGT